MNHNVILGHICAMLSNLIIKCNRKTQGCTSKPVGHPGIQVRITLPIRIFSFAAPSWCFGMTGFLIRRRSLLGSLAEAVNENVILGCLGQPPG
jgi:hypothetical protein